MDVNKMWTNISIEIYVSRIRSLKMLAAALAHMVIASDTDCSYMIPVVSYPAREPCKTAPPGSILCITVNLHNKIQKLP